MSPRRWKELECEASIDLGHTIESVTCHVSAVDAGDFEIESVVDSRGNEYSPESISQGAWDEVAEQVRDYFIGAAEAACESQRDAMAEAKWAKEDGDV